ncbi:MAG: IS1595 family transposase [Planctomycetes bacterium]|nr:IS1595 family transposase [Planctomycetota bacterium]
MTFLLTRCPFPLPFKDMEDYPLDLLAFEERFSTEAACRDFLFRLRWPAGFRCPRCASPHAWRVRNLSLECRACHHQTSLTAGTIFHATRKPLRLWFRAIWYVTSRPERVSALGLQRALGLGSYVTAWAWLYRLRQAMLRPSLERLKGTVEVDKAYLGGLQDGVHALRTEPNAVIAVAAEQDGKGIGRIRLRHISGEASLSLVDFVRASVEPGSLVRTAHWSGYAGLEELGYVHKVALLNHSLPRPHALMPRVRRVTSHLERWLIGSHQGAISLQHLPEYLGEFSFHFNHRASELSGQLFYRLLEQAILSASPPSAKLPNEAPVSNRPPQAKSKKRVTSFLFHKTHPFGEAAL